MSHMQKAEKPEIEKTSLNITKEELDRAFDERFPVWMKEKLQNAIKQSPEVHRSTNLIKCPRQKSQIPIHANKTPLITGEKNLNALFFFPRLLISSETISLRERLSIAYKPFGKNYFSSVWLLSLWIRMQLGVFTLTKSPFMIMVPFSMSSLKKDISLDS